DRGMLETIIVILARDHLVFGVFGEESRKLAKRFRVETGGIIVEQVAQFAAGDPPDLISHRRRHSNLPHHRSVDTSMRYDRSKSEVSEGFPEDFERAIFRNRRHA